MAFKERIELLIDVTTSGAKSGLRSLKGDIDEADGAFNKIKAGAAGTFGGMGNLVTAGLASAGTAIAGFGLKAIGDFQQVALGAGEMAEKLGLPVEDASRLMEVAGDLGIEVATLESAMGRMNRTAGVTPEKFAAIGAEIARNRDGTINVTETFKNAAEAISRIPDAAGRAKAGQEIFGRGWQSIAELIMSGADGIAEAMASVEDAKVIDPEEVEKARKFRDMMDSLKGRFESFALTVGEVLVDAAAGWDKLSEATKRYADEAMRWLTFRDLRADVENLAGSGGFDAIIEQQERIALAAHRAAEGIGEANAAGSVYGPTMEQVAAATEEASSWFAEAVNAMGENKAALDSGRVSVEVYAARQKELEETLEGVSAALRDAAAAALEQIDSYRTAADSTVALEEAQEKFAATVGASNQLIKEGKSNTDEYNESVDAQRDAMIGAADAAVQQAADFWTAQGATMSATDKVDTFNASLLSNARFATPAARDAIAKYIVEANGVPPEKSTDIIAAIQRGDFDTAARLLAELSRSREAAIRAEANTAAAERDLDRLTRPRTVVISNMIVTERRATGGLVGENELTTLVGEQGPEVVSLPAGSRVHNAFESKQMLKEANAPARGGNGATYNVTVNANGASVDAVAEAIQKAMWRAGAKPPAGGRRAA